MIARLRKNSRYRVVFAFVLLAGLSGRLNDAIAQGTSPATPPGGDQSQQFQKMMEHMLKGAAPATKPDDDQAQQIQEQIGRLFNDALNGAGNQQTQDNSATIQNMIESMINNNGNKGEMNIGIACVSPLMMPSISDQNDIKVN